MARDGTTVWEGDGYATASGHHRTFDDWFLDQHPPRPADRVVDAGCGSGEFTARLASLVPDGQVVGVEPDASMLQAAARHRAPNLAFRQGRLQELDRACEPGWADLVVSRAVLHWIPPEEHPACHAAVWRTLRPGGWFHAEAGGAGNVRRVRQVLDEIAGELGIAPSRVTFPDAGVALELLEQAGFEVPTSGATTVAQRRRFDRDQLVAFLRTQAAVALGLSASDPRLAPFLDRATERLDDLRHHDGSFDQTFVRLHVRCRRPA